MDAYHVTVAVLSSGIGHFHNVLQFPDGKVSSRFVLFAVPEGERYRLHFTDVKTDAWTPEPLWGWDCYPWLTTESPEDYQMAFCGLVLEVS